MVIGNWALGKIFTTNNYQLTTINYQLSTAGLMIIAGIKLLEEREKIYKGRFEELKREIIVGVEASERGEVIDGEVVFRQLKQRNQAMRKAKA
ncbi:MAG: hypothetical protein AAF630_01730 [Cyanobacteria bacterium P01_C01_bin.38]